MNTNIFRNTDITKIYLFIRIFSVILLYTTDFLSLQAKIPDHHSAETFAEPGTGVIPMNDFASFSCHDRIADFKITQVQRDSHFDMGESHYHPYYEFYYLLSGQCRCFISHSIYRLFPGDLIMIPPSVLHRVLYETKRPAERINIFFSENYMHRVFAAGDSDLCAGLFSRSRLTVPSSSRPQLERLMTHLRLESESSDPYAPLMTRSLFSEFLVEIARCQNVLQTPQFLDETSTAIKESARYIYEHYEEPVSLAAAAAVAHMNPTYFSKKFRETTGFGFKEYLTHIRLQNAAHLLRTTDTSITEIAGICGFSDGNYFGDAFRKHYGMSPRAYRLE